MLDAFADRVAKPRLYLTDKMQIALGNLIITLFLLTMVSDLVKESLFVFFSLNILMSYQNPQSTLPC